MTFQGMPNTPAGRGQRLNQPSNQREQRKPPTTGNIVMCDGHEVSPKVFDNLKRFGSQKLRHRYVGCAKAVRSAIPAEQWTLIGTWIDAHRPETGLATQQADLLMATLIGHAASRLQQNAGCLFDEMIEKKSAHQLLPSN